MSAQKRVSNTLREEKHNSLFQYLVLWSLQWRMVKYFTYWTKTLLCLKDKFFDSYPEGELLVVNFSTMAPKALLALTAPVKPWLGLPPPLPMTQTPIPAQPKPSVPIPATPLLSLIPSLCLTQSSTFSDWNFWMDKWVWFISLSCPSLSSCLLLPGGLAPCLLLYNIQFVTGVCWHLN